jgi:uncharacterized membrane protein
MPANLLTPQEVEAVVAAIAAAEKETSGEIRVHMENYCRGNALERAIDWFNRLGMHRTIAHNGVLIYIAVKDRKVAIFGDKGIHEQVHDAFWEKEIQIILQHFRAGEYKAGLVTVIEQVGEKLKAFFPYQAGDANELSNDISFGDQ